MRIDDSLQMTGRLSEIVDRTTIQLLDDFLESRFELAHALAGVACEFLFEFLSRAQIVGPWLSGFRNVSFASTVPLLQRKYSRSPADIPFGASVEKSGNVFPVDGLRTSQRGVSDG